jgi:hypothetical protein
MLPQSEVDALEPDKRFARSAAAAPQNTIGAIQWNYDRTEIIADGVIHALGITLGLAAASTLIILTSGYSLQFMRCACLRCWCSLRLIISGQYRQIPTTEKSEYRGRFLDSSRCTGPSEAGITR